ncbi:MAG: PCP reductase family protein [Candidatus Dormibacteria bacterium]
MTEAQDPTGCPFAHGAGSEPARQAPAVEPAVSWDPEARAEARRRAHESAERSHLDPAVAEQMTESTLEQRARRRGVSRIDAAFVALQAKKLGHGHPLSDDDHAPHFTWTDAAQARLERVPAFCRELTRWRVEATALKRGLGTTITEDIMDLKFETWGEVSREIQERYPVQLPWTESARQRFERIPDFVRGQVQEAIEGNALRMGATVIDDRVVDSVVDRWARSGDFHEGRFGFH